MSGEIGRLTEELTQDGEVERRRDAASRLRDLGFARRTSLEKRGTLTRPAESTLAEHELDALHAALEDDDRSVRLNAIIIVGDLGDATSVSALQRHCEEEDDPEIKLAAIDSLGDIGGAEAISTLTRLASDSRQYAEIRLAALTELEELAAKRITSGPDRRFDPAAEYATVSDETHEPGEATQAKASLVQALHSIESETGADDLLRLKAADVRAYLTSGA
jgi:HEAT repeat protein